MTFKYVIVICENVIKDGQHRGNTLLRSLARACARARALSLTHKISLSLSLSHTHSLVLSLSLSLSLSHSLTLSLSLSYTHIIEWPFLQQNLLLYSDERKPSVLRNVLANL